MDLILQTLHGAAANVEVIARLCSAQRIVRIDSAGAGIQAWRCCDVQESAEVRHAVQQAADFAQFDACFLTAGRGWQDFKLLAMDMDSTLITIECIDEIADMQGIKPQVAEITEAAMRGEIGFNESLTRRVALLAGLDASALERVYEERLQLSLGAENMLACAKQYGLKTLLVSGGFTFFTERMQTQLGLDFAYSNVLEIVDGKLTGKVVGEIVNAEKKRDYVLSTCAELGVTGEAAIAMGDGANDLLMMKVAGLSVAFRAKPKVKAQADVAFDFVGLNGLNGLLA
jgi:phosphoserine phosphatase